MIVECLECQALYQTKLLTYTEENVDVHYLKCPECAARVVSYVADPISRAINAKIKRLIVLIDHPGTDQAKRFRAQKKYRKLATEHQRVLQENFSKYGYLIQKVIGQ